MADSKHTPGPWKVDNGAAENFDIGVHSGPPWARGSKWLASVMWRKDKKPFAVRAEAEANAALTAAAPDLLAACELVLSEHECYPFYESYGNADQALAACAAAIAKATGREGS